MIAGQECLACMDDAARLRDALGVKLPTSLPEIYQHRVSHPLRDLFLRYLQHHTLVTTEQLARQTGLGIAVVEEQLHQLREQGLAMNLQQDVWVSDDVFRRLRLRSLQAAREATRPVSAIVYARLLLERQGVLPATDGSPALLPQHQWAFMKVWTASCELSNNLPASVYPPRCGKVRSCPPACAIIRPRCSMNYWRPVRLSGPGKKIRRR